MIKTISIIFTILLTLMISTFSLAGTSNYSCSNHYSADRLKELIPNSKSNNPKKFAPISYQNLSSTKSDQVLQHYQSIIAQYRQRSSESAEFKIVIKFLENPKQTIEEFQSRFEKAVIEKGNGYLFDFSDVGTPILNYLEKHISIASEIVNKQIGKKIFSSKQDKLVTEYINEIKRRISEANKNPSQQTYLEVTHLSHYFSRLIGFLNENGYLKSDNKQIISLKRKAFLWIDRRINGYRVRNISQEYSNFLKPVKTLDDIITFDEKSLVLNISNTYDNAFKFQLSRQDKLPFIMIPSSLFLERDIFYIGLARGFNIYGVTYDPIFADGFYRPSGDFLVHDYAHVRDISITHEIVIQKMINENGLTRSQAIALMEKFTQELIFEINTLENQAIAAGHPAPKDFKNAVDFLAFNVHHDRGYPTTPKGYWYESSEPTPAPYLLHLSIKYGGQFEYYGEVDFENYKPRLKEARNWLDQFWFSRLKQEIYETH